jgi:hypothetical protein
MQLSLVTYCPGEVVAPVNFATVEPQELQHWKKANLDRWTFLDVSKPEINFST